MGVRLASPAATPSAGDSAPDFRVAVLRTDFQSVITQVGNSFLKIEPRLATRKLDALSTGSM